MLESLQENIGQVKQRIELAALKAGRNPADIMLVAVSKTVDSDTVRRAHELGLTDFGENRVQSLKPKSEALPAARWHLIGQLQTNKVKDVVGRVFLIHSLDRWSLAEEMNRQAGLKGVEIHTLLQVNVAGEEQKAGIEPNEVESFLEAMGQLPYIKVQGLMTMAAMADNPEEARPVFRELYQLKHKYIKRSYQNVSMQYLSMGMSQDYEVAVEEGANILRIGTAIFHPE